MIVFFFYLVSILVLLTICAGIADLIGWLYPDWMSENAEAPKSLDDVEATRGTGS